MTVLELLCIQALKFLWDRNIQQKVLFLYFINIILGDIWSLGIIYYEILTGTTPWHCKTIEELIHLI